MHRLSFSDLSKRGKKFQRFALVSRLLSGHWILRTEAGEAQTGTDEEGGGEASLRR